MIRHNVLGPRRGPTPPRPAAKRAEAGLLVPGEGALFGAGDTKVKPRLGLLESQHGFYSESIEATRFSQKCMAGARGAP